MKCKRAIPMLSGGILMLATAVLRAAESAPAYTPIVPKEAVFYVYENRGSRLNHYAPSGWMGDYGDLKMNQGWVRDGKADPSSGKPQNTAIQLSYSAERKQGAGWSGIFWQHPANNWGDKRGGYNLSAYSKLKFEARGEKGGEIVDKFFMGGISGQTEEGDSDEASVEQLTLTKEWKTYEISLKGLDVSRIIGGFGFAANADANPDGFVVYVDNIRYEK